MPIYLVIIVCFVPIYLVNIVWSTLTISLLSAKHPSPKLAHWAMGIQEMDLNIRH